MPPCPSCRTLKTENRLRRLPKLILCPRISPGDVGIPVQVVQLSECRLVSYTDAWATAMVRRPRAVAASVGWSVPPMPGRPTWWCLWRRARSVGWSVPPMPGRPFILTEPSHVHRVSAGQFHRCLGDTGGSRNGRLFAGVGWSVPPMPGQRLHARRRISWSVSAGQFHRCLGDQDEAGGLLVPTSCRLVSSTDAWATSGGFRQRTDSAGVGWSVPPMPGRLPAATPYPLIPRCRLVSSTDAWATATYGRRRGGRWVSAGQFHRCLGDKEFFEIVKFHVECRLVSSTDAWATGRK